jgi:hypothetical protein
MMLCGADYYPGFGPRAQWPRELDLMAEAGLTVVRVGDLCWATMEPGASRLDPDDGPHAAFISKPFTLEDVLEAAMDRPAQGANPGRSLLDVSPPVPALAARDQGADRLG